MIPLIQHFRKNNIGKENKPVIVKVWDVGGGFVYQEAQDSILHLDCDGGCTNTHAYQNSQN